VEYQILIAIVGVLLVAGLACVWVSVESMSRLDKAPPIVERRKAEPEEEKEEVTRLGKPIKEVKF
jgi:hypothetical protein